jgi:small subunit ribosomal protein S19e
MTTIYDVPASELIKELAMELKKAGIVKPPQWTAFVKTGPGKEKQPEDEDWWYIRSASILRKIYAHGPIGIPTLKRKYGGKRNRGCKPEKKRGGSGAVIKNILRQLEEAGLIKKTVNGRAITRKGISLADRTSHKVKGRIPELKKF